MIRAVLLSLFGALLIGAVHAQVAQIPNWPPKTFVAAGATFQGPGDIVASAAAFWSTTRAYSAAKRGTVAVNLCQPAGLNCVDVSSDATTGFVPNAPTVNGAPCDNASHVCFVHTVYEQTAGGTFGDMVQASGVDQPTWKVSAVGSLPCSLYGTFGATTIGDVSRPTLAQPFTIIGVFDRTGHTTSQNLVLSNGSFFFYHETTPNTFNIYAGSSVASVAANDSALHAGQGVYNGASSFVAVDGTNSSTVNVGASGFAAGSTDSTANYDGLVCEIGIWPSAFNTTQTGNMNTNQHSATSGYNF